MIAGYLPQVFGLLVGHALADFALQNEWVARYKSPKHGVLGRSAWSRKKGLHVVTETIWPWVLSSHALIHAGAVWLLTGSWTLGLLEFAFHAAIDLAKGSELIGFHGDQALHVACKFAWAGMI